MLRLGGSYGIGYRSIATASGRQQRALHSANVGATLVLDEEWLFGLSGSADYARHSLVTEEAPSISGGGITASLNYETGPWDFGGFLQYAVRLEGEDVRSRLFAGEVGGSYRFDTRLRFYTAAYGYYIRAADFLSDAARGAVVLFGIRVQL